MFINTFFHASNLCWVWKEWNIGLVHIYVSLWGNIINLVTFYKKYLADPISRISIVSILLMLNKYGFAIDGLIFFALQMNVFNDFDLLILKG